MAVIAAVRKLWRAFFCGVEPEAWSLVLALIVIVGLTMITAKGP
jgi:hypothetical protein